MTGKPVSQRDIEQLSAYLDSELSDRETRKLEARLSSEPELMDVLTNLRRTSQTLGQLPQARAPRNYRLTPEMLGQPRPAYRPGPMRLATAIVAVAFVVLVGADALQNAGVGRLGMAGAPAVSEMQSAPEAANQARSAPAAGAPAAQAETPVAQDALKSGEASPQAMLAAQPTGTGALSFGGGATAKATTTPPIAPGPTLTVSTPLTAPASASGQTPTSGLLTLRGLEAALGLALIVLLGIQVRRRS